MKLMRFPQKLIENSKSNLKNLSFMNCLTIYLSYREFLGGFRKRKQERRKKAKDELEKKVKEDRKRIKQEVFNQKTPIP